MYGKAFDIFWFQISSPEDPTRYFQISILLHVNMTLQLLYVKVELFS